MGRILAISSQVVRGHVGLSAIVPALQRLGHEVLAVPTIVLSNHPGHKRAAGTQIEVNTLESMLEVIDANGWLTDLDAMITGYMPTIEHVALVAKAIDLVRSRAPRAAVLVDPVLGDDPRGLYIEQSTAMAIRSALVPRANIITPNRFELSWLSGCTVDGIDDVAAARARLPEKVQLLATSVPAGAGRLANVSARADSVAVCAVDRLAKAPHGTGDLLTGLYIGLRFGRGLDEAAALGRAVGGVRQAIANSVGRSDLSLVVTERIDWAEAPPAAVEIIPDPRPRPGGGHKPIVSGD